MKNLHRFTILSLALAVIVFTAGNCLFIGYPAGQGPQGSLFQKTSLGASANDLSNEPEREGRACTNRLFLFVFNLGFTWGEGTVAEAAQDGGISRIQSVDTEQLNVLSIYSQQCTVVRGDTQSVSSSTSGRSGFTDTVRMKNGVVHSNVKTIVQGTMINIITSTGRTITVPKTQVQSIRKGR